MFNLFSHVGIVVQDIDQALPPWRDSFGLTVVEDMHIPEEGVRSVFLFMGGAYGRPRASSWSSWSSRFR